MKRRNQIALAVLVVILLALVSLQTPILHGVRSLAWQGWINLITLILPVGRLAIDNDVSTQLERLTSENVRLKAELRDYEQLREQLGSPAFTSYRVITAEAAARPLDAFGVSFVINRGAKEGVTLQAPVVVYDSTLIGFVSELYEHSAQVTLLLHPSTNLSVEILNESNPKGLLIGRQYTSLAVTTIPRDATLTAGDEVVTVARENLPPGLRVGRIGTTVREENQAYQEARLVLPYDPGELRAVHVIVEP